MGKHDRTTWFDLTRHEDPPPGDPPTPPADNPPAPTSTDDPPAAELGDAGKRALDAERQARKLAERERAALAAKVKEFEDRDKSEQEKLVERAEAAERAAAEATERLLRAEVANAKGLPAALAARLQGSTKEELEADADALLSLVPPAAAPPAPPAPPAAAGVGVQGTPPSPVDLRTATDAEVRAARDAVKRGQAVPK